MAMATFRHKTQALYDIFQYVLITANPPKNSTTITKENIT